jgi:putative DNA primase/helicase
MNIAPAQKAFADPEAQPDVVLVDGSRAAIAATRIFDGSKVAVWDTCDPSLIAGREVLIWPNAIESSIRKAREIAGKLADDGCVVRIVDAGTFAAYNPDTGGHRDPPAGWNAADALAEGPGPGLLRYDALRYSKKFEPEQESAAPSRPEETEVIERPDAPAEAGVIQFDAPRKKKLRKRKAERDDQPAIADLAPQVKPTPGVDPTQFRQTDAGNALLFVELFKMNIRYVERWKRWLVWDGNRWLETSDVGMVPLARAATEHMFDWSSRMADEARGALRKHALSSQQEQRLRAMLNIAKGETVIRIEPDRLDADPLLLGCPTGTLDLRTGKMLAPRREDFVTKRIAVDYDALAECPNFLRFIYWAMKGDHATIEHLQRVAGYLLTGSVREEKLIALFGGGANGKTTLVMTLFSLLGDYAAKGRKDLLLQSQGEKGAASPDVAALQGKRLVVVSETDAGCLLAEAQVKEITSNEPIAARRLHADPVNFIPTHKTVLMTNHRPFVRGTDDGIWRRLNIIGFGAKISDAEKDPDFLKNKLLPELPGILAWAVQGCLRWQRDGLRPSEAVQQTIDTYRSEMDFVGQWIEERCDLDTTAFESNSTLYCDYSTWAKREQHPVLGPRTFGESLRERGFARERSKAIRGFCGLRLRRQGDDHEAPHTATR